MSDDAERAIAPMPDQVTDPLIYRIAVAALAMALVVGIIGGLVLAALGKEIPPEIVAVVAGAGGAIAGMLVVQK